MTISAAGQIAGTVTRLRADPASGLSQPTVTAELINGHARLSSGSFNWDSDLGSAIGGQGLAPSPTQYLLGALAGCAVAFLYDTLAPQFEVTIAAVQATARCRSDIGGLVGIDGSAAALQNIELSVAVSSFDSSDRLEALFQAWRERCPIYLALIEPSGVVVDFAIARERVPVST